MKFILVICTVLLLSSCKNTKKTDSSGLNQVTTTYYFIRHAEKDQSDPSNRNPKLSAVGIERAKAWGNYFDTIHLSEIYATDYARTQTTAAYVATKQNLAIQSYDASNLYSGEFKIITEGLNVLIVGHSNTTPAFVNKIIKKETYPILDENEYSSLFKVLIKGDNVTVQKKTVN